MDALPQGDATCQWYERMVPANKHVEISVTGMLSDMISTGVEGKDPVLSSAY